MINQYIYDVFNRFFVVHVLFYSNRYILIIDRLLFFPIYIATSQYSFNRLRHEILLKNLMFYVSH